MLLHKNSRSQPAGPSHNCRRDTPDLFSWVSCLGVYMAVLTSKYPEMIKPLHAGISNNDRT